MEEETTRRRQEEEPPVAGWQTIYCSLALILVAFFAMLVSYSSIEEKKLSIFRKGRGILEEGNPFSAFDTKMMSQKNAKEREERVMTAIQVLNAYCEKMGLGGEVHTEITERGFRATFADNIFFPSGVAVIKKEAYPNLDKIARIAKEGKFSLRVEGHTDDVPIQTSRFPSNWELSATRAVNVLRYLDEKGNIPAERLFAEGFSQYQPVAPNDTLEGRQKNRRVVFDFAL